MTNIKITQEAREVAEQVLGEMALGDERRAYEVVQSLINRTLERAAKIGDDYEGTASNERCDDPQGAAAYDIADAIRALKDN